MSSVQWKAAYLLSATTTIGRRMRYPYGLQPPRRWWASSARHSTSMLISRPSIAISDLPLRKRQVLQLLLCGEAEKRIAIQLGVTLNTVHVHVQHIYRTFGVNCRPELTALFIEPSVLSELEQSCREELSSREHVTRG